MKLLRYSFFAVAVVLFATMLYALLMDPTPPPGDPDRDVIDWRVP